MIYKMVVAECDEALKEDYTVKHELVLLQHGYNGYVLCIKTMSLVVT